MNRQSRRPESARGVAGIPRLLYWRRECLPRRGPERSGRDMGLGFSRASYSQARAAVLESWPTLSGRHGRLSHRRRAACSLSFSVEGLGASRISRLRHLSRFVYLVLI